MKEDAIGQLDIAAIRAQFPALRREVAGRPAVFLDGPAGSQIPASVADAVRRYLLETNANHGGVFATSRESDELLYAAHTGLTDFLGADDPECVVFGANMTTLTFAFSRALAQTWRRGDEIVVTELDHDANVSPWRMAARDAGVTVRAVRLRPEDQTLDLDHLRELLTPRTRLVAVTAASNALGTVTPIEEISRLTHAAGAKLFVDAVHYAPHRPIDVLGWQCDALVCSAYKFFGPHVGVLWGKRELLEALPAYKVRPASNDLPDRWMTGTQNHEGIAGALAAVEYLASLPITHRPIGGDRRAQLLASWQAIGHYESALCRELLKGLARLSNIKIWGIADPKRWQERVPTVSFTHSRFPARHVAEFLAERGIFAWHGNFYALPLTEALGLEPEGLVRIGLLHYNTGEEVSRLLESLAELE